MSSHIMPTYGRFPVTFVRGEGVWLWDKNNKRYLDALSGIGVCNLGHAHEAVHQAICEQSRLLLHTSNLYGIESQEVLAEKLCHLSGMENVFFCNSGAEANEAALKITRLFGHQRGIERPYVLVMNKSFHGRTMATLSATGNDKVRRGFDPLLEGFIHVPFNNITALEHALSTTPNIVAIMVEPVQGEGGVNIPADNYLARIRSLCDQHDLLMITDEIQTGMGRTGKFLAYQHNNILPDICTMAKALGNGVPIGACLASGKAAKLLVKGSHGSTFGGNPLACAAALSVLQTYGKTNLIADVPAKGQLLTDQLKAKLMSNAAIAEIRNKGLMIAVELTQAQPNLADAALHYGILINMATETTIRLLPPLIISEEQVAFLTDKLSQLINASFN